MREIWNTRLEIIRGIRGIIPKWLLRSIHITDYAAIHHLICNAANCPMPKVSKDRNLREQHVDIEVSLYPWAWLGLGYFHKRYGDKIKEHIGPNTSVHVGVL